MNTILLGVSLYILIQFALGLFVSRGSRDEQDFILAGRSLGPLLGLFTVFATWFGAESVIGAAGNIYANGFSGSSSDPFGYGLCLVVLGIVFAIPLWKRNYTTFGDFFRERYSNRVEKLFVLLVVPSSLFWAAAQVRAFGQVVSAISSVDVDIAIALAAILVTIYTMIGGMRATAITDLIQGLALMLGLMVLMIFIVDAAGGVTASIQQLPLERIRLQPDESVGWLTIIEKWAVPVCGATLAAESISRILATRSSSTAAISATGAGLLYIVIGVIPLYIGLVGPDLIAELDDPEQIVPRLAAQYLTPFFYVLFCGALVSAILSTVDSALLAAAALISHNIVVPLKPQLTATDKISITRISIAILGLLAFYLATTASGVHELIWTAVSFGTAGVFVVGTLGLFTRLGGEYSAFAALIAGSAVWVAGEYVFESQTPYLFALIAAAICYLLVSAVETRSGSQMG